MSDYEGPVFDEGGSFLGDWDGGAAVNQPSIPAYGDGGAGYVGEWPKLGAPSADYGWIGCVLALLTLGISLFVMLIVNGFRAARVGDWGKAMLFWSIPGAIAIALLLQAASDHVAEQAAQREFDLVDQEVRSITANPAAYFSFTRVRGPVDMPGCGSYCDHLSFGEYRLTSKTQWVGPALNSPDWVCREPSDKGRLGPGETLTLYCVEQERLGFWTPVQPCVILNQPWEEFQHTMCIDPFEGYVSGYLADHFEFDAWIAEDDCDGVCPGRLKSYATIRYTGVDEPLDGRFYIEGNDLMTVYGGGFRLSPGEEQYFDMNYDLSGYGRVCADVSVKGYLTETVCVQLPP